MPHLYLVTGEAKPRPHPRPPVVDLIKKLLAEAEKGEIVAIAAVTIDERGDPYTQFSSDPQHLYAMNYGIDVLAGEIGE